MICRRKSGILRRGVAAFLLLLMIGSSAAFAVDTGEMVEPAVVEQAGEEAGQQEAAEETGVSAATDENGKASEETIDVEVEAGSRKSEEIVEEIREEGRIVIFAQGSEARNKTVKIGYNKRIKYEEYKTHDFYVTCDGEKMVAYCIEPAQGIAKKKNFTAKPCTSKLLSKALYYSHGNPGYKTRTAEYLKGLNLKSSYKGTNGNYAFCHVMLSYIYDGESEKGDAFKGCSSNTKTNVKKFVKAIKSWPDPITEAELALSATSFDAGWNEELNMQETPEITVTGTEGNSINVPVPENVDIIKDGNAATSGSVKMKVGESFRLRAPASVRGRYTSPVLATAQTDFTPYIIKLSGKQDQMFGVNKPQTISYTVNWVDFGGIELIKKSSDENITGSSSYYSLEKAKYELFSKESNKSYGVFITDAEGRAELKDIPYGNYYIKEIEAPSGFELDEAEHDIILGAEFQSETVIEKPRVPDIITYATEKESGSKDIIAGGNVVISDSVKYMEIEPGNRYKIIGRLMDKATGEEVPGTAIEAEFSPKSDKGSLVMEYNVDSKDLEGKTVVAFEKLHFNDEVIAVHEDIDNRDQSVRFNAPVDRSPDMGDRNSTILPLVMAAMAILTTVIEVSVKKQRRARIL